MKGKKRAGKARELQPDRSPGALSSAAFMRVMTAREGEKFGKRGAESGAVRRRRNQSSMSSAEELLDDEVR